MAKAERGNLGRILRPIPTLVGLAAGLAALISVFGIKTFQDAREALDRRAMIEVQERQLAATQSEIHALLARADEAQKQIQSAATIPAQVERESSLAKLQVQIASLRAEVGGISKSLAAQGASIESLNRAFLSDPERALSIPLLRKDVDQIRAGNQHDIDALRDDMKANLDLNKWLIGLIAAGVVGTILNNMLQGRRTEASPRARFE